MIGMAFSVACSATVPVPDNGLKHRSERSGEGSSPSFGTTNSTTPRETSLEDGLLDGLLTRPAVARLLRARASVLAEQAARRNEVIARQLAAMRATCP